MALLNGCVGGARRRQEKQLMIQMSPGVIPFLIEPSGGDEMVMTLMPRNIIAKRSLAWDS